MKLQIYDLEEFTICSENNGAVTTFSHDAAQFLFCRPLCRVGKVAVFQRS